jgi:hypothetical protein
LAQNLTMVACRKGPPVASRLTPHPAAAPDSIHLTPQGAGHRRAAHSQPRHALAH